jgi:hypothetical protein
LTLVCPKRCCPQQPVDLVRDGLNDHREAAARPVCPEQLGDDPLGAVGRLEPDPVAVEVAIGDPADGHPAMVRVTGQHADAQAHNARRGHELGCKF